jgi:hypothetical protein
LRLTLTLALHQPQRKMESSAWRRHCVEKAAWPP